MSRLEFVARLLFVVAAFGLAGYVAPAHADEWTGRDKVLHVAVGAGIGSAVTLATGEPLTGFVVGTAVGFAKEVYDSQNRATHTPSAKDFIATAAGAALGAYATGWVIRRNFIGYQRSF